MHTFLSTIYLFLPGSKASLPEAVNPNYTHNMWEASPSQNPLANVELRRIHLIGIKGTGMCALAEILVARGAHISGSDTSETFYTDKILEEMGVQICTFNHSSLPTGIDLVIYSAAYNENNPHVAAARNRGFPILTYPEALGYLSDSYEAIAVAGVHGKTTTTAIAGTLVKDLAFTSHRGSWQCCSRVWKPFYLARRE